MQFIVVFCAIWLGCGFVSWAWQARQIRYVGLIDILIIFPTMLSGPIGLYRVARAEPYFRKRG